MSGGGRYAESAKSPYTFRLRNGAPGAADATERRVTAHSPPSHRDPPPHHPLFARNGERVAGPVARLPAMAAHIHRRTLPRGHVRGGRRPDPLHHGPPVDGPGPLRVARRRSATPSRACSRSGPGIPIVETRCAFAGRIMLDDVIDQTTEIGGVGRTSFRSRHVFTRDGEVMAARRARPRVRRPRTRETVPVPDWLRARAVPDPRCDAGRHDLPTLPVDIARLERASRRPDPRLRQRREGRGGGAEDVRVDRPGAAGGRRAAGRSGRAHRREARGRAGVVARPGRRRDRLGAADPALPRRLRRRRVRRALASAEEAGAGARDRRRARPRSATSSRPGAAASWCTATCANEWLAAIDAVLRLGARPGPHVAGPLCARRPRTASL